MERDRESHAASWVTGQKSETEITDVSLPGTRTRETQQGDDTRCLRVSSVRLHPITRKRPRCILFDVFFLSPSIPLVPSLVALRFFRMEVSFIATSDKWLDFYPEGSLSSHCLEVRKNLVNDGVDARVWIGSSVKMFRYFLFSFSFRFVSVVNFLLILWRRLRSLYQLENWWLNIHRKFQNFFKSFQQIQTCSHFSISHDLEDYSLTRAGIRTPLTQLRSSIFLHSFPAFQRRILTLPENWDEKSNHCFHCFYYVLLYED